MQTKSVGMNTSTVDEKVTAVVSALVAAAILGAVVTAEQGRAPTSDLLATLESDLRFQIEVAYRDDPNAGKARIRQLDDAIDAWRHSPRCPEDEQVFVEWLRTSLRRSMPGELNELPPTPPFSLAAPPQDVT